MINVKLSPLFSIYFQLYINKFVSILFGFTETYNLLFTRIVWRKMQDNETKYACISAYYVLCNWIGNLVPLK